MNIRVVKFVTGEEVVADVTEIVTQIYDIEGSGSVTGLQLVKPLALVMNMDEKGNMRPAILPYAVHVKDSTITVKPEKTLYNEPANDELQKAYREATGAIQTPGQGGLVVPR